MSSFFLPQLKVTHQVSPASSHGKWDPRESAELDKLGRALEASVDLHSFDVDSIPDIWARPLLFQMALLDPDHALHDQVTGEWRGLASVIALKRWRSLPLTARRIDLTAAAENNAVAEMLRELAPRASLSNDTQWSKPYLLFYEDRHVIGMTSPVTLFCTSKEYFIAGLPWSNGTRLFDPLSVPDAHGNLVSRLNDTEREAVAWWLDQLLTRTNHHPTLERSTDWNRLTRVIDSFKSDLGMSRKTFVTVDNALGMDGGGLSNYLDEVPAPPEGTLDSSNVRILTSPGKSRDAILIDADIARQWQVSLDRVMVWGGHSLNSVMAPGQYDRRDRQTVCGQRLPCEWILAEDIILPELCIIKSQTALDSKSIYSLASGRAEQALYPLNPDILSLLSAEHIYERSRLTKNGNSYEFTLSLPLAGLEGDNRKDVELKRTYERSEVKEYEELPLFDIWPNFVQEGWKEYYTLYHANQDTFYLRPTGITTIKENTTKSRRNEVETESLLLDAFPEALIASEQDDVKPTGLLLIKQPATVERYPGTKWTVGVDFGTSNTTIYVNDGVRSFPLEFLSRSFPVTNPGALRDTMLWLRLIPDKDVPSPFPTLFRVDKRTTYSSDPTQLVNGNIAFLPEADIMRGSEMIRNFLVDVNRDIKWGKDGKERAMVELFIKQLVTMIRVEAAAENVASVDWRYSVPTSFTREQRRIFGRVWGAATGIRGSDIKHKTESAAAASFFADMKQASVHSGVVCIDIGGGSTDIALWKERSLIAQSSLRFAARDILVETLLQSSVRQEFSRLLEDRPIGATNIELLLRTERERIEKLIERHSAEDVIAKDTAPFITIGLTAILRYCALLVSRFIDRSKPQFPDIYIGGNGSRMFHWVAGGSYVDTAEINELFREVLADASGLDVSRTRIYLTDDSLSKHEVASGLVSGIDLAEGGSEVVLTGESSVFGGEALSEVGVVTEELIRDSSSVLSDLSNVRATVSAYNDFTRRASSGLRPLEPTNDPWNGASKRVADVFSNYHNKQIDGIERMSVYIEGIRAFLDHHRQKTS